MLKSEPGAMVVGFFRRCCCWVCQYVRYRCTDLRLHFLYSNCFNASTQFFGPKIPQRYIMCVHACSTSFVLCRQSRLVEINEVHKSTHADLFMSWCSFNKITFPLPERGILSYRIFFSLRSFLRRKRWKTERSQHNNVDPRPSSLSTHPHTCYRRAW